MDSGSAPSTAEYAQPDLPPGAAEIYPEATPVYPEALPAGPLADLPLAQLAQVTVEEFEQLPRDQQAMLTGEWIMMASSNVMRISYHFDAKTLHVDFLSLSKYEYYGVTPRTFLDFVVAESPGRFVWRRLRDQYPYKRTQARQLAVMPPPQVVRPIVPPNTSPAALRDLARIAEEGAERSMLERIAAMERFG